MAFAEQDFWRRTIVRFSVTSHSPLRIGASVRSVSDDGHVAQIARNEKGDPVLPGTALTGVLRAVLERRVAGDVSDLFGDVRRSSSGTTASASALIVDDATISAADGARPVGRRRTHASMDRRRHAPASGLLSSTIEIHEQAHVHVRLELQALRRTADHTVAEYLLAHLLDELHVTGLYVGSRTRRGFGHLVLDPRSLRISTLDLRDPRTLERWILASDRDEVAEPEDSGRWMSDAMAGPVPRLGTLATRPWGGVRFVLGLVPAAEPYISAAGPGPGSAGPDAEPIELLKTQPRRLGLPGSSIAGTLRSRVERITRTMLGNENVWDATVLRTVADPGVQDEKADPASQLFGTTAFAGRSWVHDAPAESASTRRFDHVALDRFTGGAADRLKFDVEALTGGSLTLTLDVEGFDPRHSALALLALLDVATGDLPLGSRTTRGYGTFCGRFLTVQARGAIPGGLHSSKSFGWTSLHHWENEEPPTDGPLRFPNRRDLITSMSQDLRKWLDEGLKELWSTAS